jgi:hypothetical protein
MVADRSLCDRSPKVSARASAVSTTFGDAEHGLVGCFAADAGPIV